MFQKLKEQLGLVDYGTKCHGYAPDGQHAHYSRCRDDDCPRKIADNEFFNKALGKWVFVNHDARDYDRRTKEQHQNLMDAGCFD